MRYHTSELAQPHTLGPIITFPTAVQIATRLHNLQRYSSRLLFPVASLVCATFWLRIRGEINILMYYTTRDNIQILFFALFLSSSSSFFFYEIYL